MTAPGEDFRAPSSFGWSRGFWVTHSAQRVMISVDDEALGAGTGGVAASTQNQALSALLFLYRDVLGRDVGALDQLVRAKRPARLPAVLSRAEVKAVLGPLGGTPWLVASLLYGAGPRLLQCLRLRVKDVDAGRNTILVRSGKGDRDRVTVFPVVVRRALEAHLKQVRRLWESGLADPGFAVVLPGALARRYPAAGGGGAGQGVVSATRADRARRRKHQIGRAHA